MASKMDDSTAGVKALKIFRKLLVSRGKLYQMELANEFNCSPQTIIRIMNEVESVVGDALEMGLDCRRKWYRMRGKPQTRLGLDFEELRYISICRDLAAKTLPRQILARVDDTIFALSMLMAEHSPISDTEPGFQFYSKGRIDYTSFFPTIGKLIEAMENHQVCLLRYKAAGRDLIRGHRFAPRRVACMNQALYILGAILTDRNAVKHFANFAIHRIKRCVLTDERFDVEFPETGGNTFGLPWHEPRDYQIRFNAGKAADYVSERIWADEQKLEYQPDGSVILSITTRSEPELLAWVRSFGEEATLVQKALNATEEADSVA